MSDGNIIAASGVNVKNFFSFAVECWRELWYNTLDFDFVEGRLRTDNMEKNSRKKKKLLHLALTAVFFLVFIFSAVMLLRSLLEYS